MLYYIIFCLLIMSTLSFNTVLSVLDGQFPVAPRILMSRMQVSEIKPINHATQLAYFAVHNCMGFNDLFTQLKSENRPNEFWKKVDAALKRSYDIKRKSYKTKVNSLQQLIDYLGERLDN